MTTMPMRVDSRKDESPMPEKCTEILCMVCEKPIVFGKGRFSVGENHYHPECYDVKRSEKEKTMRT